MNLGQWMWDRYHNDPLQFCEASSFVLGNGFWGVLKLNSFQWQVMGRYCSVPQVAESIPRISGPKRADVPGGSCKGFYLNPWHLSFAENAKYGRFPPNVQLRAHMGSFLSRGYETEREPLEVRFDQGENTPIEYFTVKYVDGHTKGLIVQSIFALLDYCTWCPVYEQLTVEWQ